MKLLILLTLFSGIVSCTHKKQPNCKKIKNGRFHMFSENGRKRLDISKNEFHQAVYDRERDTTIFFWLHWFSDCGYEIIGLTKKNAGTPDTLVFPVERPEGISFKYNITGVTDKYYLFEVTQEGKTEIVKDTMWIDKLIGGFKSMGKIFHHQDAD